MKSRMDAEPQESVGAVFRDGEVHFDEPPAWDDGTRLRVMPVPAPRFLEKSEGHVIIVGFGLSGRCVADLVDGQKIHYTIIEKNEVTVETQRALGRTVVPGDVANTDTLIKAGLNTASILALTIPDETAVLEATSTARRLRPKLYIIARTNYASKGMRASQLGADDVVKAEQAVAVQFYDRLYSLLNRTAAPPAT